MEKNMHRSPEQILYEKRWKRNRLLNRSIQILVFLFFFIQWEVTTALGMVDSFFFSSPSLILKSLRTLTQNNGLLRHIRVTLFEILLSFALVVLISLVIAVLFWYFDRLSTIFEPYLVILNSLPKSALAPLFIVWLGTGMKTIIVAGISVAVFGSIISLYTGFRQADDGKIRLVYALGGTKRDVLKKVILPGSVPLIISTMKVNIGLSLVGVVIGEFLAARQGLGYLIIYGTQTFKMSMVITSLVLLCLIAILLFVIIDVFDKMIHRRKRSSADA